MLIIIPIRTESVVQRTPTVNYVIIGANIFFFFLFHRALAAEPLLAFKREYLTLHTVAPELYQFFAYQFIHADTMHLMGNLLFLWVFGNSVNSKMGHFAYALFYLSGGVFAAWGFAMFTETPASLVGASGAIAAVTTAYLALYPRSRVTVLIWLFIFIRFIEVPAMILILVKVIVWDNIIAPNLGGGGAVAHGAHLAGYFFGFAGALGMLLISALPRDQFDILAVWKRWNQRREFAAAMAKPGAATHAQFGSVARQDDLDPAQRLAEDQRLDEIADLRANVSAKMNDADMPGAMSLYEQLITVDDKQCLSQQQQLELARAYYSDGQAARAAAAFERFVAIYPHAVEGGNIRLLLGIIYARDLRQYEAADKHLTDSMESLRDTSRRDQCAEWLKHVRLALGRTATDT